MTELYFYMSNTYSEYDPSAIIYIDDVNLQGAPRCMQRFTRNNGYSGDYIDMYDNSNIKYLEYLCKWEHLHPIAVLR